MKDRFNGLVTHCLTMQDRVLTDQSMTELLLRKRWKRSCCTLPHSEQRFVSAAQSLLKIFCCLWNYKSQPYSCLEFFFFSFFQKHTVECGNTLPFLVADDPHMTNAYLRLFTNQQITSKTLYSCFICNHIKPTAGWVFSHFSIPVVGMNLIGEKALIQASTKCTLLSLVCKTTYLGWEHKND